MTYFDQMLRRRFEREEAHCRADREREQFRKTVARVREAQGGNILGRTIYLDDDRLPWHERWLPLGRIE